MKPTPDPGTQVPESEGFVAGLGASARGLEALEAFLSALPDDPNMAFVVVQHLSPDFDSDLVELLQNCTELPVQRTTDGTRIENDHIYVIAPDTQISVESGVLRSEQLPELDESRDTIDRFFRSLAMDRGPHAVGILFSGSGADGTAGLRAIRNRGGVTLAQDLDEAGFEAMPRSAIDAGVVDAVAPAGELADRVVSLGQTGRQFDDLSDPSELSDGRTETLDAILNLLHDRTGHDFSRYKRPTLLRRIGRRMQVLHLDGLESYLQRLREDAAEVSDLFEELLIGVTEFFRDEEVWELVRDRIVPELLKERDPEDTVRAWVPGCGTGQEAYTVASLLVDHAESIEDSPDVKVFATDLDRKSIEYARDGVYPASAPAEVPDGLVSRMFTPEGHQNRVSEHVRSSVLFAVHNALADPPFSNLDFVSCRNLLIYLQPPAQRQLLQLLHYGLNEKSWLVTGHSETINQTPNLFDAVSDSLAVYRSRPSARSELVVPGRPFGFDTSKLEKPGGPDETDDSFDLAQFHRDTVVSNHAPPSVLVDENYRVVHVLGDVEPFVTVPTGRPTDDVLEMLSDSIRPRVRALLFEVLQCEGETSTRHVSNLADSGEEQIAIGAARVEADEGRGPFVELSFRTLHPERHPPPLERPDTVAEDWDADTVIQQLERQLEEMRERLNRTVEDYESSNAKLRASNEELMSMNEELQSTTEELETSKEELRSLNEELTTVNQELNAKVEELDEVNNDLQNLLRSTEIGTIFLNRDFELRRFTDPVTEYFHILPSDIGRPLSHVNHSLETDMLLDDARRALDELTTVEREVETDSQQHYLFRALPYVTSDDRVEGVVLTFVDITARKRMQTRVTESELKFRTVFESAADPMVLHKLGEDGERRTFDDVNGMAVSKTGMTREVLTEQSICDLLGGVEFDCEDHLQKLVDEGESSGEALMKTAGDADPIPVEINAKRIEIEHRSMAVEVLRDITEQKRFERALVESKDRAERLADLRSMLLSTLSHDVRSPLTGIVTMADVLHDEVDEDQLEMVERIESSAEQLRQILDSILRMASVETTSTVADPESFELVAAIREIVDLHTPRARREDLSLEYSGPDPPVDVTLDPGFVTQILNNLVDNALKYTTTGGVTLHLESDETTVRLYVEDTGMGIPEEARDRIFGRYETGTSSDDRDSIGLGLAITELLVESMDGTISVDSVDGSGTRFSIEFPRYFESDSGRQDEES